MLGEKVKFIIRFFIVEYVLRQFCCVSRLGEVFPKRDRDLSTSRCQVMNRAYICCTKVDKSYCTSMTRQYYAICIKQNERDAILWLYKFVEEWTEIVKRVLVCLHNKGTKREQFNSGSRKLTIHNCFPYF